MLTGKLPALPVDSRRIGRLLAGEYDAGFDAGYQVGAEEGGSVGFAVVLVWLGVGALSGAALTVSLMLWFR